ncbi:MAG: alpha/beta hydrolase [Chloroflexi bacterium]|nr:alpha/beta hydrolase [Chloroflexota bacterium]
MATLKFGFLSDQRTKIVLGIGSLMFLVAVFAACSGNDEPATQVAEPTATAGSAVVQIDPTATKAPVDPTLTPVPTSTPVPPAPTATAVPPTSTSEPEIDRSVVEYFKTSDSVRDLLAVNGELFITSRSGGFVSRRAVPSGDSLGSVRGGREGVRGITFDGETVWTADFSATEVRKFSIEGKDLGRFKVKSPQGIVFDGLSIWVTNKDNGTVTNLDLDGSEIGVYEAGQFPEEIAFDGTNIWVTNPLDESVTQLSTAGEILRTVDLGIGRQPFDIAADENYVWVSNGFYFLTRIPVLEGSIREFVVGRMGNSGGLALSDDSIYVTHRQGEEFGSVSRLSYEGDWLSTVIVGGDNPYGIAVIDDIVYVGLDFGNQIAAIHPEAMAAGAPTVPEGVVETELMIDGTEVALAGVLAMPAGPGPHPAVLMIDGSGANNRDGVFTWRQAREVAHHLALEGIASLRLDDRGIGRSTGKVLDTTIASRIVDATDALEVLKQQDGIDPSKVGISGFSEGGVVVAAVAAETEVAFVVSIAGPVAPHRDLLLLQAQRFLEADGPATSYIERVLSDVANAHNTILTGEGLEELERQIELGSSIVVAPDYIMGDPKELVTTWFQDFLKHDPGPDWAAVDEPILAIFGEKDWAVPAEQNEPLLREILAGVGHTNHHIQVFPVTNHFFQPAISGAIGELGINPREFIPGFLELISDWISEQISDG